ncbi:MAG: hypothetical protein GY719_17410 [bacterium]|nr:hypothetical protein [bacterium]
MPGATTEIHDRLLSLEKLRRPITIGIFVVLAFAVLIGELGYQDRDPSNMGFWATVLFLRPTIAVVIGFSIGVMFSVFERRLLRRNHDALVEYSILATQERRSWRYERLPLLIAVVATGSVSMLFVACSFFEAAPLTALIAALFPLWHWNDEVLRIRRSSLRRLSAGPEVERPAAQ